MEGRRLWVSVEEEPRLGTVIRHTYAPKSGAPLLAVELDEPVSGTESVVVNPDIDDAVFEPEPR